MTKTVKIRIPEETLAMLDQWAALHRMPRFFAVRRLMLQGLVYWSEPSACPDFDAHLKPEAVQ
jgi:hypothetical protein